MKIKLVQMNIIQNQINSNLEFILNEIDIARKEEADVIVFPELCLTTTIIAEHISNQYFIDDLLKANKKIVKASGDIVVIWGNIDYQDGFVYNCGFVASQKKIIHQTLKKYRATSSFAQSKEYFEYPLNYENKEFKIGNNICKLYINHDLKTGNDKDVDIIFHLDSHYYRKSDDRVEFLKRKIKKKQILVSVNSVNIINNGKHIVLNDGCSYVTKKGIFEILNQEFQEESRLIDIEHLEDTIKIDNRLFTAMVAMIRKVDGQLFPFKPKWIVGASGGLDSSVVLGLLSVALGSDRIIAVNLPSQYNSDLTKSNAYELCKKLNIEFKQTSIENLVKESAESMKQFGFNEFEGLTLENAQARLRGHLLSTISSMTGGLISNNTNKVESALGYGTLYGDTIGAIGFLADCTKMDVVSLANEINKHYNQEIIPLNLLPIDTDKGLTWDFKPSAELSKNQVDPMKWGYHDYLISRLIKGHSQIVMILKEYIDGYLLDSKVGKYMLAEGLDDPIKFIDDFKWVLNNMNKNIFKRIQGAPMLVVSDCAIGLDSQEVQGQLVLSQKANKLIKEIENA